MNLIKFRATENDEGRTIFKFLVKRMNNVPLSKIEKLFRKKDIKINTKRINDKKIVIKKNDLIEVYAIEDFSFNDFIKIDHNLSINYEDENILIVEKPAGIAIHDDEKSLDNQVLSYLNFKKIDSFKPSHVGRLDKGTSGLIIYAKNYKTLVQLNEKTKNFEKYYLLKSDYDFDKKHVVVYCKWKNDGTVFTSLEPKRGWTKMETLFLKEKNLRYAKLISGKKHQIRISLQALNFPIYGDRKYGGKWQKRMFLHSYKIIFHKLNGNLEYLNNQIFISKNKF